MQPWVIMLLRFCNTSLGWQLAVPQPMWATRRSPGLTKRTKAGDSWLSRVYERTGLADVFQISGKRGVTWACSLTAVWGLPPGQAQRPRGRVALECGSWG